jgi:ABC-type amino acid transport substrate-binding protein
MNFKKPTLLLAALGAACLLAACKTQSTTPSAYAGCKTWEQQAGTTSAGATTMLSADLAKFIGVQEVLVTRTATGLAAVQATVYNCADVDVLLTVRTRFSGDVGQSEPPSTWKNVFLTPRGQATYTESAISQTTTKVSVDINDGNRAQSQFGPGQSYAIPPK